MQALLPSSIIFYCSLLNCFRWGSYKRFQFNSAISIKHSMAKIGTVFKASQDNAVPSIFYYRNISEKKTGLKKKPLRSGDLVQQTLPSIHHGHVNSSSSCPHRYQDPFLHPISFFTTHHILVHMQVCSFSAALSSSCSV